jgi:hypothetical protein
MVKKYKFGGRVYETLEEAEEAVEVYASSLFDDEIDKIYDEICICGCTYSPSYVLKTVDDIAYRSLLTGFAGSLFYLIEEIQKDVDTVIGR